MNEEVKVEEVNEPTENIIEEKPKKEKKEKRGRSLFVRIMDVALWVVLLGWMAVCVTDFIQIQREEKPVFCKKFEKTDYDDGIVEYCTGLGYKVFYYNRRCYKASEFGPFWTKDRSVDHNTCK